MPNWIVCHKIRINLELEHLPSFDSSLAAVGLELIDIWSKNHMRLRTNTMAIPLQYICFKCWGISQCVKNPIFISEWFLYICFKKLENSTMCKEIYWKIPIFMLESVGKFHCGHWNVLEMSTVPAEIHMLENSISPVDWSCDIHHICRNSASVLATVHWAPGSTSSWTFTAVK